MWSACVLWALLALAQARSEGKLVQTEQGPVRGYPSPLGDYFEFFGIPYATAPKGNDKFKAPLDPPTWTEVLEAVDDKIMCPQPNMEWLAWLDGVGNEDCLVINVFVPNTDKKNLSVMAYVHGGAFFMGVGTMISHEKLLSHEVIFVNFNYRLGPHGFLCLGTKDIPGNAGMKDQVAALRWVKRNIAKFGGNADDVTIIGGSAGSASVEHLMLSPMAKGLFTKVIAESGSALSAWAATPDPIALAKRHMEETSGKSSDDVIEIERFYKSLTIEQLAKKFYSTEPDTTFGFVPCVESRIEGEESFYNKSPIAILTSGDYNKVPFLPGFSREEGLMRIDLFDQWADRMEHNFADFLPQDLMFTEQNEKKHVAAKVKKFYFKDAAVSVDTLKEYVEYFSDVMFGYSAVRAARLHALNSVPVYLYEFTYVLSNNTYIHHAHSDKIRGANHGAQCIYLHSIKFFGQQNFSSDDMSMQYRLTKMWTDFAKFGTPVKATSELLPVSWDTLDPQRLNYMHMDLQFQMQDHILGDRVKFWDDIYEKHYREPIAPRARAPSLHTEL